MSLNFSPPNFTIVKRLNLTNKLTWLRDTGFFIKEHYKTVLGLGLIAALGRVIQLGGFGPITSGMHVVLEIVIESTRVLLFLYVLGMASIKNGVLRIRRVWAQKENRRANFTMAIQKIKRHWGSIALNLAGFLLVAAALNYLIELTAYQTCLYLTLKQDGILAASSSEWTILLFFKNLSVIPFTLVFDAVFLLWSTNKIQNSIQS